MQQTINRRSCTITEKASTRTFTWLKAPTTCASTFKTLIRGLLPSPWLWNRWIVCSHDQIIIQGEGWRFSPRGGAGGSVSTNLIRDTQGSHHLIMGTLTTNIHQPDLFSDRPSLAWIHTLHVNKAVTFLSVSLVYQWRCEAVIAILCKLTGKCCFCSKFFAREGTFLCCRGHTL